MIRASRAPLALLLAAVGCVANGANFTSSLVSPSIRIEIDGERRIFVVEPVDDQLSAGPGKERFTVHVAALADAPAMLGSYRQENSQLRFTPRFRLRPGLSYRAVYRPLDEATPIERSFTIAKPELKPSTRVLQIYPSADLLPENLLRFYLEFSAPMRSGEVYRHIHLLNAAGTEVALPFLELPQELWDPQGQRLTLLLDPGRIKRGLEPRRDVGSALIAGESYRLMIDRAWPDARGVPLALDHIKAFRVGPPDRSQPDPRNWRLSSPKAGTVEPLQIGFGKPLDHALLQRMIWIIDEGNDEIAGSIQLEDSETGMSFTPEHAWRAGAHHLMIDVDLEDRSGNSIRSIFDRDLEAMTSPARLQVESIDVPFSVT